MTNPPPAGPGDGAGNPIQPPRDQWSAPESSPGVPGSYPHPPGYSVPLHHPCPVPQYTPPTQNFQPNVPARPLGVDLAWLEKSRKQNVALWVVIAVVVVTGTVSWASDQAGIIGAFLALSFLAFLTLALLIVRALVRVGNKPQPMPPIVIAYGPAPIPPAWYRDAHGILRWHDGTNWTSHTYPPQP